MARSKARIEPPDTEKDKHGPVPSKGVRAASCLPPSHPAVLGTHPSVLSAMWPAVKSDSLTPARRLPMALKVSSLSSAPGAKSRS